MTQPSDSETYNRAAALFMRCADMSVAERDAFLDENCGEDGELRALVEALLANDTDDSFVADELADGDGADLADSLSGKTILRYRILQRIGEGGMSVVYRAQDTTLDRIVALKFLSPGIRRNPDAVERFVREAKAAAAIDHPNVCTVHEINRDNPQLAFIAMAYLEGQTLAERLAAGPLDTARSLEIAIQVCRGLEAAHLKGVVHRDIKPSNIMLTEASGSRPLVRIVDFGIARLTEQAQFTKAGSALGTVAYMAPEQIDRSNVDARADIWAMGVVLYRMVTGKLPFEGDTTSATLAAIASAKPEALSADSPLPPGLRAILKKALEKSPQNRYQRASDMLADLEELLTKTEAGLARAALRREQTRLRNRRLWLGGAALAAIAMASTLLFFFGWPRASEPREEMVSSRFTSYLGAEREPAISPDGTRIAFTWNGESESGESDIYVQLVGSSSPMRLTNTPEPETSPTWSPDGKRIAFIRNAGLGTEIIEMPSLGGPERVLVPQGPNHEFYEGLEWSPAGNLLVFAARDRIFTISLKDNVMKQLSFPGLGERDAYPHFDPAGERIAFARRREDDTYSVLAIPVDGGTPSLLLPGGMISSEFDWNSDGTGLLTIGARTASGGILYETLVPAGTPSPVPVKDRNLSDPDIRGDLLAYSSRNLRVDIWSVEVDGSTPPRMLLASSQLDHTPQFSADGKSIVFASDRSGRMQLWSSDRDGRNLIQLTTGVSTAIGTPRWSPDARWIAYDSTAVGGFPGIYIMPSNGGQARRITSQTTANILPSWSRDGKWIYFCSNSSGAQELWKVSPEGGDPIQVTRNGGWEAFESIDGKYLFYSEPVSPWTIHRLDLATGENQPIPELGYAGRFRYWGVAKNGIFFVDANNEPGWLQFWDGQSRTRSKIAKVGDIIRFGPGGLAVSPDSRTVLVARKEIDNEDIMIVENFH